MKGWKLLGIQQQEGDELPTLYLFDREYNDEEDFDESEEIQCESWYEYCGKACTLKAITEQIGLLHVQGCATEDETEQMAIANGWKFVTPTRIACPRCQVLIAEIIARKLSMLGQEPAK